jgi:hypothetical protein
MGLMPSIGFVTHSLSTFAVFEAIASAFAVPVDEVHCVMSQSWTYVLRLLLMLMLKCVFGRENSRCVA